MDLVTSSFGDFLVFFAIFEEAQFLNEIFLAVEVYFISRLIFVNSFIALHPHFQDLIKHKNFLPLYLGLFLNFLNKIIVEISNII